VQIIVDLARTYVPEFRYLRPAEILVHGTRGGDKRRGTIAQCHFMRHNTPAGRRASLIWDPPTILRGGEMCSSHLDFLLPRFIYIAPIDRLDTILHELTHIPNTFDGTSRDHTDEFYSDVAIRVRSFMRHVPVSKFPPLLWSNPKTISWMRFLRAPVWLKKGDPEGPPIYTERDLARTTMTLNGHRFAKTSHEKIWVGMPFDLREAAGQVN
jgi:hypothetical protein